MHKAKSVAPSAVGCGERVR